MYRYCDECKEKEEFYAYVNNSGHVWKCRRCDTKVKE